MGPCPGRGEAGIVLSPRRDTLDGEAPLSGLVASAVRAGAVEGGRARQLCHLVRVRSPAARAERRGSPWTAGSANTGGIFSLAGALGMACFQVCGRAGRDQAGLWKEGAEEAGLGPAAWSVLKGAVVKLALFSTK